MGASSNGGAPFSCCHFWFLGMGVPPVRGRVSHLLRVFDFRSVSPQGFPFSAPFIRPVGAFRAFSVACSRWCISLIELFHSRLSSLHLAPREGGRILPVRTLAERGVVANGLAVRFGPNNYDNWGRWSLVNFNPFGVDMIFFSWYIVYGSYLFYIIYNWRFCYECKMYLLFCF